MSGKRIFYSRIVLSELYCLGFVWLFGTLHWGDVRSPERALSITSGMSANAERNYWSGTFSAHKRVHNYERSTRGERTR